MQLVTVPSPAFLPSLVLFLLQQFAHLFFGHAGLPELLGAVSAEFTDSRPSGLTFDHLRHVREMKRGRR